MTIEVPQFTLPVPSTTDRANFPARADVLISEFAAVIAAENRQNAENNAINANVNAQANLAIEGALGASTSAATANRRAVNASESASGAAMSETSASASAGKATTQATNSSTSATSVLAIYGTTAAMSAALASAAAQNTAAQTLVASASSVMQQDLSAVAAALHRSPNAIAAMFIYDTSKDSDGGAWVDRMQGASWANEPLSGTWLKQQASELTARSHGVPYPESFDAGAWNKYLTTVATDSTVAPDGTTTADTLVFSSASSYIYQSTTFVGSVVIGQTVTMSVRAMTSVQLLAFGTSSGAAGTDVYSFTALTGGWFTQKLTRTCTASSSTAFQVAIVSQISGAGSFVVWGAKIENGSVANTYVSLSTQAGQYFQYTVDGLYYKLGATYGVTTQVRRGNKAAFPRVAGIIMEGSGYDLRVIVYDLTEPNSPMWGSISSVIPVYGATTGSCVAALNGKIFIGVSGGYAGYAVLDLPRSLMTWDGYGMGGSSQGCFTLDNWTAAATTRFQGELASTCTTYVPGASKLVNATVYGVAMTVLPDAPLSAATGLARPTIAVMTAGGVSVIRHDGAIVSNSFTGDVTDSILISGGTLYYTNSSAVHGYRFIRLSAITGTTFSGLSSVGATPLTMTGIRKMKPTRQGGMVGYSSGMVTQFRPNESVLTGVLNSRTGSDYTTGFMTGDIRRTYLSDVTVESIGTASLLVTNGTFDTDTSGWTASGGTIAVVSGQLVITNPTSSAVGYCDQTLTTIVGKNYVISADFIKGSASQGAIIVGSTLHGTDLGLTNLTATGLIRSTFKAVGTTTFISALNNTASASTTAIFDNISVKEAVIDRSYKAGSLAAAGTLTKTQVAAAAQLVAFSGFSAVNYLSEPYSSDFDFGTGTWSAAATVSLPATSVAGNYPYLTPELLPNGDFNSGSTNWQVGTADATHIATFSGGTLRYQSGTTTPVFYIARAAAELTVGKFYEFTVVTTANAGGGVKTDALVDAKTGVNIIFGTQVGTVKYIVLCAGNTFGFYRNDSNTDVTLDSVSLREVGASAVFDRSAATGPSIKLGVDAAGKPVATAYDGNTTRTVTGPSSISNGAYVSAVVNYRIDGSLALVINGDEVARTTGAPLLTLTNTAAVLTVGNSRLLDAPFPGSLALLKIGATVPSAEQAAWIYGQERGMFRPGAQVTLPATTNVIDLAYDELTDKWTAIQPGYESSWNGLVRVSANLPSAGTFIGVATVGDRRLLARATSSPGVDITLPARVLRSDLSKQLGVQNLKPARFDFDTVAFTGTTTSASTSVTAVVVSAGTPAVGMSVSGTGIQTGTTITAISGTTYTLSLAATATGTLVSIYQPQTDFPLPSGYIASEVQLAGLRVREGATKTWVRVFDGFVETVRFNVAQGASAWVQVYATKEL